MIARFDKGQAAQRFANAAALAACYFVTVALTVRYTRFEGGVAFIRAAGGLLTGTLISVERRRWPDMIVACAFAGVVATWFFGLGPRGAVPLTIVNMSEALVGAWLLTRFCPACGDLKSVKEIGAFITFTGVAAPAAMAFAGAGVAAMLADVPYWSNWLTWYTGHALGTIAVAPLVILLLRGDLAGWLRQASSVQRAEALILLTVLATITVLVFAQDRLPLLFLPFLPMMVVVFRLDRVGAPASLIVIGAIGSLFTARGLGPVSLIVGSSGLRAEFFQLYLATAALLVLPAAGELKGRSRTVEELEEQAVLHRLILDRTGDVIMTLNLGGRIRFASASSTRVLGLSPHQLVGTMPHEIIHVEDIARVEAVHRDVLRDPERTFTVEYRMATAVREAGWLETHARATLDGEGRPSGAVVIIRDVSHRKIAEARLSNAARTDPLTGIANRRAFNEALDARLTGRSADAPSVMAMFDLDHFKSVNDTYGHPVGDRVLISFAEVLRTGVRAGDFVARLGGEEFVAIIEGDLDAARLVCERIRTRLAATAVSLESGSAVQVTVSAGIAALPPRGSSADVLVAADAALYRAKAAGRNRLFCH